MAWHPSGNTIFSVYTADDADSQISILDLNKTRKVYVTYLTAFSDIKDKDKDNENVFLC